MSQSTRWKPFAFGLNANQVTCWTNNAACQWATLRYSTPMPKTAPGFDTSLLDILVCPMTHAPLVYDEKAGGLISKKAGLAYPVRDGIPILLVEEARSFEDEK